MTTVERHGRPAIRLFVREELPGPARRRRRAVIEGFERLTADGRVASFDLVRWPKRFERAGTEDERVRETYAAFVDWARAAGVSLSPFFDVRECYSTATGARDEWIVLPVLCVAVFEDGVLKTVYPHADGDETRSVADCLADLESGGERERPVIAP
ncbi:MAG: HTH domain-containing protein [Haloarculaceae archaeon]